MNVGTVGVIGAGSMGSGIIEVAAKAGIEVIARDIDDAAVAAGIDRIEGSLETAVQRGKLDGEARDLARERIVFTTEIADLAGCDLVIEAAPEILELKLSIFAELDSVLAPGAILATNTSSIPVIDIAMGTGRPERVCGMHFFNPATVMQLVEVISTQRTAPEVADAAAGFAAEVLGKRVVRCKDRAGFVVNALLVPFLCQAIAMFEAGHATADDIDDAMKFGAGHPMGPLALCDLIGLDIMLWSAESLHAEYQERFLAPPPLLRRMVAAGQLGRKSGSGFHDY
jgi:3-hydroxybutyryl-CoA dehydrogenase